MSDEGNRVARQFGLVFTLPEYLRPVYQQLRIALVAYDGDNSFELPASATYVVDTDGKIVHALVNVDYTQREDPQTLVAILKQLQVAA